MHLIMLKHLVHLCRKREREGDCPSEPAASVEQLEGAVVQLAGMLERGEKLPTDGATKLVVTDEWLRGRIATDPDVDTEAGIPPTSEQLRAVVEPQGAPTSLVREARASARLDGETHYLPDEGAPKKPEQET